MRQQKVSMLELMLGQIANYCPVISRNTIVKNSTCIDHIWQTIRLHYGFQSTGAHFIDFAAIKLDSNEGPEDLYQRLMAFVEDNLLHRDSGITHGGEAILDEELSPTIENFIVLTWLHLIHSDLPKLVKQRYGRELWSRTLASIKPEISQALCSLLDELQSSGEFVELELPAELAKVNKELAVEPHEDCTHWFAPSLFVGVSRKIRIPNLTNAPQGIRKHDHVCCVRMPYIPEYQTEQAQLEVPHAVARKPSMQSTTIFSDLISLDPNGFMTANIRDKFREVHREFNEVFSPQFRGYNDTAGPFQARVIMGPVLPPQRKGRVPQYSRGQLQELQAQFDALESLGVFRKPEDIDVDVEYVSPLFLVKKSNGEFRLLTAFADVGRYSKPQQLLKPNVDATLRLIAQWRYIIATDLTKAFYQIPLSKSSMKYCGVVMPFKGVRVYARCAIGMPGSGTVLEELTCHIIGELLQQGQVTKVADDLYCGADTLEDLLAGLSGPPGIRSVLISQ